MGRIEQDVREAAYMTWIAEGRPEGSELAAWMQKHQLVKGEHAAAQEFSVPSAGPHARADLTNEDATPGTGILPPVGSDEDGNSQPTG
ncbi:DUF2934 domain-containing protein [Ancylobacter pratisalsi]|uniref:DUF2934 domain-containing protein n=1 Tax=Ancylobacter pratisalsi TaxID=1745854 RepID=A0A6P1YMZ2_9HYPH|nr:DUF2934 domain-containing protein [Ancylobacter pratisalsi]QIB33603.1 DUF2934 domain-containing protein [Ancylobacter pratisalsi]